MKTKLFSIIIACAIISFFSLCYDGTSQVNAMALDSADSCFYELMADNLTDSELNELQYSKRSLFNLDLDHAGWEYTFSYGKNSGFALLSIISLKDKQIYEMQEIYIGKESPFLNIESLPIYITPLKYIAYENSTFIDIQTNQEINEENLQLLSIRGFNYNGGSEVVNTTDYVNYSYKTKTENSIPRDLPKYSGVPGASNCANIAGTVAIGYYDRFCQNLIPNFETYTMLGSVLIYKTTAVEINSVAQRLYTLMSTDIGAPGTSFSGFQEGMKEYVKSQGYTYTTKDVTTFGNFSFSKYKNAIEQKKPVALFLNTYTIVPLSGIISNNQQDIIYNSQRNSTHVVVGCGYRVDNYYNSNNQLIKTNTYLRISSGLQEYFIGYLNLNAITNINHAIEITIS